MKVYSVDPIHDPRWAEFLQIHPHASVFHLPGWLEALQRTYGYEPFVMTTSPPGTELVNGLALCRVNSRLTGRRIVSLPFSDHCDPLVNSPEECEELLSPLKRELTHEKCKYMEIRPLNVPLNDEGGLKQSETFYFHKLDLTPSCEELFRSFHKNNIQRKIRRAEREGLTYEVGNSESLLEKFLQLQLLTRRRHGLPPQPRAWFRNLMDCLADKFKIRVVSHDERPIASIITIHFKDCVVYKYGCSDTKFNNLGGTALLFWKTIQEAKKDGVHEFDLGRSDSTNSGLITFKERWGATRSQLTYWRYPARSSENVAGGWKMQIAKYIFPRLPDGALIAAGKIFYKHFG